MANKYKKPRSAVTTQLSPSESAKTFLSTPLGLHYELLLDITGMPATTEEEAKFAFTPQSTYKDFQPLMTMIEEKLITETALSQIREQDPFMEYMWRFGTFPPAPDSMTGDLEAISAYNNSLMEDFKDFKKQVADYVKKNSVIPSFFDVLEKSSKDNIRALSPEQKKIVTEAKQSFGRIYHNVRREISRPLMARHDVDGLVEAVDGSSLTDSYLMACTGSSESDLNAKITSGNPRINTINTFQMSAAIIRFAEAGYHFCTSLAPDKTLKKQ